MKLKSILFVIAVVCFGLVLTAGGCARRHRVTSEGIKSTQATSQAEAAQASTAPGDLSLNASDENGVDLAEKEEIRRKYKVKGDAAGEIRGVEIRGINGSVKVETGTTDVAEVLIVRSAKKREDLQQYHQVNVHLRDNTLVISIENDRKSIFSSIGSRPEGHQRVVLKLPREVDMEIRGTNGPVALGELKGELNLDGINGQIKASRVAGVTRIRGVNGGVDMAFAPLSGKGIEIGGVNGNIDLHFEGEVNADLNTWGINGNVEQDLPNVENKTEEPRRGRVKARIGTGGTQIEISGINGNVTLAKAEKSGAAVKTASK